MRTKMTKQATKLRQEQEAEYENKLHLANRKRQEAEESMKKLQAQCQHATSEAQRLGELEESLDALRAEHKSTMDRLLQNHKAELQANKDSHNETMRQQIEIVKRDLQETSNQAIHELHKQLTHAEEARDQAVQNEHRAKHEMEKALKQTTEKAQSELTEQQQRLQFKAEREIHQLRQSYDEKIRVVEEQALKATAALESFRNRIQCHEKSSAGNFKSSVHFAHDLPGSEHIKQHHPHFESGTIAPVEPVSSGMQTVYASGDSTKENVDPRLRTLSEINNMFTDKRRLNDLSPCSSLSDIIPISTPDLHALRDSQPDNSPSRGRVNDNSDGTGVQIPPLSIPFTADDRPSSKSQALANSASRRGPTLRARVPSKTAMPTNRVEIARHEFNHLTESYSLLSKQTTKVSQFDRHGSGIAKVEGCGQNTEQTNPQSNSKIQESGSSPDFITDSLDSQNITKYSCQQLPQPLSESILENNKAPVFGTKRKHKNIAEMGDGTFSKKTKPGKGRAAATQVVPEDQIVEDSQNAATRERQSQSQLTEMHQQTLPTHDISQGASFKSSQPQKPSNPPKVKPQTSQVTSRARSSHDNVRSRNLRSAAAKPTRRSKYQIAVELAETDSR